MPLRLPELRRQPSAAAPSLPQLQKWDAERPCEGIDVCRCRKNGLANARFPIPVFCLLDCIMPAREGELADLTYVDLPLDGRRGLLDRLPYVGRGWYSKPACAEMLDSGLAQWRHFRWSLEATAHVDQRWLEQALQTMEEAWPEGEEHMAKLSINALVGLFARNLDLVYSMRTSNVQKGVFVTVSEVGERVALESGQSFEPRELLKHTRLCSAITYASVQGLTLRGRVWLCDVGSPHFTMKHLYMGCSRATSSELLSVL